jgi:hypothetical protein
MNRIYIATLIKEKYPDGVQWTSLWYEDDDLLYLDGYAAFLKKMSRDINAAMPGNWDESRSLNIKNHPKRLKIWMQGWNDAEGDYDGS